MNQYSTEYDTLFIINNHLIRMGIVLCTSYKDAVTFFNNPSISNVCAFLIRGNDITQPVHVVYSCFDAHRFYFGDVK